METSPFPECPKNLVEFDERFGTEELVGNIFLTNGGEVVFLSQRPRIRRQGKSRETNSKKSKH
jgi:hypothetical protein